MKKELVINSLCFNNRKHQKNNKFNMSSCYPIQNRVPHFLEELL